MNRNEPREYSPIDQEVVVIRETQISSEAGYTDDTAEIRANIEQTRAEMSETIDALQERLSPANLKEQAQEQLQEVKEQVKEQVQEQFHQAKEMVREATIGRVENMVSNAGDTLNETRYTVMDTIKQNPIPAALVGIGLSWLYMNRSSTTPPRYSGRGGVRGSQTYYEGQRNYRPTVYEDQRSYRPNYEDERRYADNRLYQTDRSYSSGMRSEQGQGVVGSTINSARETAGNVAGTVSNTASNLANQAQETAGNVASTVSNTASNLVDTAQETVSNITDQAQYQAQRVEDRFQQSLRENPLAVGALALALGAAVGLAAPQTQRENQIMGEARDTLIDKAQEVASDTMDKVQRVASEVTDEAKQTVKEQAREHGLTS